MAKDVFSNENTQMKDFSILKHNKIQQMNVYYF